jgi:hypothetical protein
MRAMRVKVSGSATISLSQSYESGLMSSSTTYTINPGDAPQLSPASEVTALINGHAGTASFECYTNPTSGKSDRQYEEYNLQFYEFVSKSESSSISSVNNLSNLGDCEIFQDVDKEEDYYIRLGYGYFSWAGEAELAYRRWIVFYQWEDDTGPTGGYVCPDGAWCESFEVTESSAYSNITTLTQSAIILSGNSYQERLSADGSRVLQSSFMPVSVSVFGLPAREVNFWLSNPNGSNPPIGCDTSFTIDTCFPHEVSIIYYDNIDANFNFSISIDIEPLEYWEYATSQDEPVYDKTTGAELKDPLS